MNESTIYNNNNNNGIMPKSAMIDDDKSRIKIDNKQVMT